MASTIDEYTLSWDDDTSDFFLNLKELLQRKEFVDVTLVTADGHMFSAHRLILSALSSYFRQMFVQVPANQQTFVFLKDVSKKTLEDLLTFIYSGTVDVKHENLKEVLSTAKTFNIKGLSDRSHTHTFDSHPLTLDSFIPTYKSVQYQSTQTIRVPESTKPDLAKSTYYRQAINAFDQYLSNVENEDANEMNEHEENDYNSNRYDNIDYDCSNMGYDDPMAMDHEYEMQDDQWDINSITYVAEVEAAKLNVLKPVKRMKCGIDTTGYDMIADIRKNGNGSENLFYNNHKFNKHNKINKYGQQRWQCTIRADGQRCRGAASTMEMNGTIMMKVVIAEHSH